MAQVVSQGKVKLDNGQIVNAQNGGWYDAAQYWDGTLSAPGQINSKSNQPGAGSYVSKEVIAQTNPANVAYVEQQQKKYNALPSPSLPSGSFASGPTLSSPSASSTGGSVLPAQPAFDLNAFYNTLYSNSGIKDIEQKLADQSKAYADQQSKINDNPYLSESSRTGRLAKLSTDYQNATKNDQDLLAMKKADVETKLNLQLKQLDINSQQARDALDRFNTLLQLGALDGASGQDIANITMSTGISSDAIQSAINANKAKNVSTSMVSFDDGVNQGFALVNTKTGEIINKQIIGASKPSSSGSGTLSSSQQRDVSGQATKALQTVDTNEDKLISLNEYKKALEAVVAATGVDVNTADDYLTKQMTSLGYNKWKW